MASERTRIAAFFFALFFVPSVADAQLYAPIPPAPNASHAASESDLVTDDDDRFRILISLQAGLGSADAETSESGRVRDTAEYDIHFSPGFFACFLARPWENVALGGRFEYLKIQGSDGIDLDTPQISMVVAGILPIGDTIELFIEGTGGIAFTIQTDGEDLESPKLGARAGAYIDLGSYAMRAAFGHDWYLLKHENARRRFEGEMRTFVFDIGAAYDF